MFIKDLGGGIGGAGLSVSILSFFFSFSVDGATGGFFLSGE